MKKNIFLIALLFIFTGIVKAETITYDLCKTGCTYSKYDDIMDSIAALDNTKVYEVLIDIKDGETYEVGKSPSFEYGWGNAYEAVKSHALIKGSGQTRPKLIPKEETGRIKISFFDNISIENVNFDGGALEVEGDLYRPGTLKIKNSNINIEEVRLNTPDVELEKVDVKTNFFFMIYVNDRITIKDSKIKIINLDSSEAEHLAGIRMDNQYVTIINTEIETNNFYATGCDETYLIEDSNIKITKNFITDSADFTIKNTDLDIKGSFEMYGKAYFENVNLVSGHTVGLKLADADATLKNVKISGATEYALEIGSHDFKSGYIVKADNVDLLNNKNSIHLVTGTQCMYYDEMTCDYYTDGTKAEGVEKKHNTIINAWFTNSKIKSIITEDKKNLGAGNAYFDNTNTWSSTPTRGNDLNKYNVVELNKGKVLIEESNKGTLKLNVDKEVNLNTYFEDLGEVLGEWLIEDNSIVKVIDGKIIPLKVGTTKLTANINNTYYVLSVTVTEDMLNPETKDILISLVVILFIITGGFILLQYKKVKEIK